MAASTSPLLDFVTRLQIDAAFQAQFGDDPVTTMTTAGLSADDQAVIQSRDLERLNEAIGQQTGETSIWPWHRTEFTMVWSYVVDTDQQPSGD